ncbi:hypothetical protein NL676_000909 [Syzygium grande]|nr:hypothetical protein NL676_000909 [Syzygium grande]
MDLGRIPSPHLHGESLGATGCLLGPSSLCYCQTDFSRGCHSRSPGLYLWGPSHDQGLLRLFPNMYSIHPSVLHSNMRTKASLPLFLRMFLVPLGGVNDSD